MSLPYVLSFETLTKANKVHNDLKPQNYLVKFENGYGDLRCLRIVLTDFGLVGHDTKGGTPVFASPKCFEGQRAWTADLFSLGRVFLYMTLTKNNFSGRLMIKYIRYNQNEFLSFTIKDNLVSKFFEVGFTFQ